MLQGFKQCKGSHEKEVSTFSQSPDSSLYMLPSSPQVYNAPQTTFLLACSV